MHPISSPRLQKLALPRIAITLSKILLRHVLVFPRGVASVPRPVDKSQDQTCSRKPASIVNKYSKYRTRNGLGAFVAVSVLTPSSIIRCAQETDTPTTALLGGPNVKLPGSAMATPARFVVAPDTCKFITSPISIPIVPTNPTPCLISSRFAVSVTERSTMELCDQTSLAPTSRIRSLKRAVFSSSVSSVCVGGSLFIPNGWPLLVSSLT